MGPHRQGRDVVIPIKRDEQKDYITQRDLIEILMLRKELSEVRVENRLIRSALNDKLVAIRRALLKGAEVEDGLHEARFVNSRLLIS